MTEATVMNANAIQSAPTPEEREKALNFFEGCMYRLRSAGMILPYEEELIETIRIAIANQAQSVSDGWLAGEVSAGEWTPQGSRMTIEIAPDMPMVMGKKVQWRYAPDPAMSVKDGE